MWPEPQLSENTAVNVCDQPLPDDGDTETVDCEGSGTVHEPSCHQCSKVSHIEVLYREVHAHSWRSPGPANVISTELPPVAAPRAQEPLDAPGPQFHCTFPSPSRSSATR